MKNVKTKRDLKKDHKIKNPRDNDSLLHYASKLHPDINLRSTYIIGEQHLVSSTFELIKELFKKGLKKENISLIGKCYSTNPYVYAKMVAEGIDVSLNSLTFNPLVSYDSQYKQAIDTFYKERLQLISKKKVDKVIVLSDGGTLNEVLQREYRSFSSKLIGVEQTSSGYERLKKLRLHYPIVNVARSEAKLQHESPFIARISLERLFLNLRLLDLRPRKILIIGNGAVGGQIFNLLQSSYEVEIFDIDQAKSTISKEEFVKLLPYCDLILGCTGKKILSSSHYKLLKNNAILASLSSSDREFDAVRIRSRYKGKMTDCHQHLYVDNNYLMNCGFPIIFDSSYDIIDTQEFQLTRSLLLLGILQGVTLDGAEKKFIPLDFEDQREVVQKYNQMLKLKRGICGF